MSGDPTVGMSPYVSRAARRRMRVALAAFVLAVVVGVAGTIAQAHVHVGPVGASSCVGCAVAHERSVAADVAVRLPLAWDAVGAALEILPDVPAGPDTGRPHSRGPPRIGAERDHSVTTLRAV